jgi:YVTN family beta-propeller protein
MESDSVSLVNGTTDELVSIIPVGENPAYAAVDTSLGTNYGNVFVTNYLSNTVSVISWRTNSVVRNISVSGNPKSIVFDSENGNFYVSNYGSGTVAVIDGNNDSVLGFTKAGREPNVLAFDPLNHDLYVTNFGDSSVTVIPTDSMTLTLQTESEITTASRSSVASIDTNATTSTTPVNSQTTISTTSGNSSLSVSSASSSNSKQEIILVSLFAVVTVLIGSAFIAFRRRSMTKLELT